METRSIVCGYCLGQVTQRLFSLSNGSTMWVTDSHISAVEPARVCDPGALRYVDARWADHNDLSDALGEPRGSLEWHLLLARVVSLVRLREGLEREIGFADGRVIQRSWTTTDRLRALLRGEVLDNDD